MWTLTVLVVLGLLGHGSTMPSLTYYEMYLSDGSNSFSHNLYSKLGGKVTAQSFVYSPYAVHSCLDLLAYGAGFESVTTSEIHYDVLKNEQVYPSHVALVEKDTLLRLQEAPNVTIEVGKALYVNPASKMKSDFVKEVQDVYLAEAGYLEFGRPGGPEKQINEFARKHTGGEIQHAVAAHTLSAHTSLVLESTFTFNGAWAIQFDPQRTHKQKFYRHNQSPVEVTMMTFHQFESVGIRHDDDTQTDSLELPFQNDRFSFYIVTPRSISAWEKIETIPKMMQKVQVGLFQMTWAKNAIVSVPKFQVKTSLSLAQSLKDLGLDKAFLPDKAKFSRISNESVHLDQVYHQAMFSLHEYGVGNTKIASKVKVHNFGLVDDRYIADWPFMFFVLDKHNFQVLLQGKYTGP